MNKIRLIAFAIVSLVAVAPFAGAQVASSVPSAAATRHGARGVGRGKKHKGPMRGLKLSAAEKASVKSVHAKYSAQMKSLRASNNREAVRGLRQRERGELRASLSPANQRQFDANVQQAVASRGKGGR